MNTRIASTLVAALLLSFGAGAADTRPAAEAKPAATEQEQPKKTEVARCQQVTGSRIRPVDAKTCDEAANRPFRSYSAEELEMTGRTLAEALRAIDPRFQ